MLTMPPTVGPLAPPYFCDSGMSDSIFLKFAPPSVERRPCMVHPKRRMISPIHGNTPAILGTALIAGPKQLRLRATQQVAWTALETPRDSRLHFKNLLESPLFLFDLFRTQCVYPHVSKCGTRRAQTKFGHVFSAKMCGFAEIKRSKWVCTFPGSLIDIL